MPIRSLMEIESEREIKELRRKEMEMSEIVMWNLGFWNLGLGLWLWRAWNDPMKMKQRPANARVRKVISFDVNDCGRR